MQDFAKTPEFARYTIESTLGTGGMGTVYLAQHEILDRPVALKVPHNELASNDHFVERFLREARALGTLHHKNIVTVYDAGIEKDTPYIAMKYIAGRTLSDIIRTDGPVPVDEAARWGFQMADALAYLHDQHILHRDLKSANVIIDTTGEAIIADFGIAQIEPDSNLTRGVLGTPAYMSPEQAMGKPLDARSDMHSLGVILYQCLTGELPFQDDNSFALLQKVIHATPAPLSEVSPETPLWLIDLVHRCLQKDPDDRFENDRNLLAAFLEGMPSPPAPEHNPDLLPAIRLSPKPVPAPSPVESEKRPLRVLDLIKTMPNPKAPGFENENTVTFFEAYPGIPSPVRRILRHGVLLLSAALLALVLLAPLAWSYFSGNAPAISPEKAADDPSSQESPRPVVSSTAESASASQPPARTKSTRAPASPPESAFYVPTDTASTGADSLSSSQIPLELRPLSVLPLGTGGLEQVIPIDAPSLDSLSSSPDSVSPRTVQKALFPPAISELSEVSTRRALLGALEKLRKEGIVAYGDKQKVSQPDFAFIFLMNTRNDGLHAMLVPSQEGWIDAYSGKIITEENGHFFEHHEGLSARWWIHDVEPIWVELRETPAAEEPAPTKRRRLPSW